MEETIFVPKDTMNIDCPCCGGTGRRDVYVCGYCEGRGRVIMITTREEIYKPAIRYIKKEGGEREGGKFSFLGNLLRGR